MRRPAIHTSMQEALTRGRMGEMRGCLARERSEMGLTATDWGRSCQAVTAPGMLLRVCTSHMDIEWIGYGYKSG